jgi:long-chain acyl-CoA synthetase
VSFTLAGLVRDQSRQRPEKTAVSSAGRDLTYRDLDRRSSQAAQALRAAGVGEGDRVALIDRNGPEFFELLFAAAKLGAVLVAVNWRLTPSEMAFIVDDSAAKLLVVGAEVVGQLDDMGELPLVGTTVVIGKDYEDWLTTADASDPGVTTAGDAVVAQMYTSGTTGLPKGALITNTNIGTQLQLAGALMGLHDRSVALSVMPLYHIAGSAGALIGLFAGATVVLHREVDPAAIVDAIESARVTFAILVPAVIQMVLAVPGVGERDFSSIEGFGYGASPISEAVMLRASELFGRMYQLYGLTETTGAVTSLSPEALEGHPERLRSAGAPLPRHEVRIAGPDGAELPTGMVGEVCIRGPLVMLGYWHRPDATAQAIDADGWFHSGDAGYMDEDGYLYIHDRIKDMIITGAENVYPAEVENILMAHPAIADAAVIGVPDERWGETVKAVLVRAQGDSDVGDADVIAYCRTRLATFKCPTSIDWVSTLPRNPSGKILKRELREPYWAGRTRAVN